MPSRQRRLEVDGRADRLESEIRDSERATWLLKRSKGLPSCSNCNRTFEEASRHCPRCDTKTMGYIRPIPERHEEEAARNAYRRAKQKIG